MAVTVHIFTQESSKEVYDLTQTSEEIESGDVLIVEKEKIAAVFDRAWPMAITVECGAFHSFFDPDKDGEYLRSTYPAAVHRAEWIAINHDWNIIIPPPF